MAGPGKKNGKSQRFSVRFSSLEGLLVNRGEFTLISLRRPGEAVSYANAGERLGGLSWRGKVNDA